MDDATVKSIQGKIRSDYTGRVLEPLHDWVYAKRIHRKNVAPTGIILAGTSMDEHLEYEVIAVGPGVLNESGQREPMSVKVGDIVIADGQSSGFILDGVIHYSLRDTQIVGILRGELPPWMQEKGNSTVGIGRENGGGAPLIRPAKRMPSGKLVQ